MEETGTCKQSAGTEFTRKRNKGGLQRAPGTVSEHNSACCCHSSSHPRPQGRSCTQAHCLLYLQIICMGTQLWLSGLRAIHPFIHLTIIYWDSNMFWALRTQVKSKPGDRLVINFWRAVWQEGLMSVRELAVPESAGWLWCSPHLQTLSAG